MKSTIKACHCAPDVRRFKNNLAEIKEAICKRIEKITKLQDEISQQENEVFEYMAKKEQLISILTAESNGKNY